MDLGLFEWDDYKEKINIHKHKIDFRTAVKVFKDEDRVILFDEKHSLDEDRFLIIGSIDGKITVLTVVYTERNDLIRIISARKANNEERRVYYDSCS